MYSINYKLDTGIMNHSNINTYNYGNKSRKDIYDSLNINELDPENIYFSAGISQSSMVEPNENIEGRMLDILDIFKSTFILNANGIVNRGINPNNTNNGKINEFQYATKTNNINKYTISDAGETNIYWPVEYSILQNNSVNQIKKLLEKTRGEIYSSLIKNSYYLVSTMFKKTILNTEQLETLFTNYSNYFIDIFYKNKNSLDQYKKQSLSLFDSYSLGILLLDSIDKFSTHIDNNLREQLINLSINMIDRPDNRFTTEIALVNYITILLENGILSQNDIAKINNELERYGITIEM
jgi:hypothetical protein